MPTSTEPSIEAMFAMTYSIARMQYPLNYKTSEECLEHLSKLAIEEQRRMNESRTEMTWEVLLDEDITEDEAS